MRKSIAVVGLLASAMLLVPVGGASATHKNNVCNGGDVCWNNRTAYSEPFGAANVLYDNDTGTDGNLSNNTYPVGGAGVNNTFSSIKNSSGLYARGRAGFNDAEETTFCPGPGITQNSNGGSNSNTTSSHRSGTISLCS